MKASPKARLIFYSRIDRSSGCWTWLAARDRDGYGTIQVGGQKRPAHRIAYEALVGPIPDGKVIDHLCRNRACVNPDHLEPVTNETNVDRGLRSGTITHCVNGHEYTPGNTYLRTDSGRRKCRACNAAAQRRRKARIQAVSNG